MSAEPFLYIIAFKKLFSIDKLFCNLMKITGRNEKLKMKNTIWLMMQRAIKLFRMRH